MARRIKPLQLPGTRPEGRAATDERRTLLDSMHRVDREIGRIYRAGPFIRNSLAYEMESLGDEALIGHESAILHRYADYQRRAAQHRRSGASVTSEKFSTRARVVLAQNAQLLARIKPVGRLTRHGVASRIFTEWDRRGDGGARPALITLRRWVQRAVPES